MMRSAFVLLVLFATALVQCAFGQEGTYRLMPDDVLRIQVYGEQQINAIIPVGRDGNISAPFVGIIRAQGKTTSELQEELVAEYKKKLQIKNPIVSVTIEKYRDVRATVVGAVNRPSTYVMRPGDTIVTLLGQGGGPLGNDRADLKRATLRRGKSKELIPIDLYSMLVKGDTSQNYEIEDGDELNIPEATANRIMVLGSVAQPGTYPYTDPMTVSDALSLARWEIRYRSRMSKTMIIRPNPGKPGTYTRILVNFVAFIAKGDASQNITLQAGDVVYVPETNTPDIDRIANIANTLFVLDRFSRDGILGFRLIR